MIAFAFDMQHSSKDKRLLTYHKQGCKVDLHYRF